MTAEFSKTLPCICFDGAILYNFHKIAIIAAFVFFSSYRIPFRSCLVFFSVLGKSIILLFIQEQRKNRMFQTTLQVPVS